MIRLMAQDGAIKLRGLLESTGALMFDTQQPCLQTETVDIPVDTTTLADSSVVAELQTRAKETPTED